MTRLLIASIVIGLMSLYVRAAPSAQHAQDPVLAAEIRTLAEADSAQVTTWSSFGFVMGAVRLRTEDVFTRPMERNRRDLANAAQLFLKKYPAARSVTITHAGELEALDYILTYTYPGDEGGPSFSFSCSDPRCRVLDGPIANSSDTG